MKAKKKNAHGELLAHLKGGFEFFYSFPLCCASTHKTLNLNFSIPCRSYEMTPSFSLEMVHFTKQAKSGQHFFSENMRECI